MSNNNRDHRLRRLRANPNPDVLVIGGGINGIGVFRELALQGVDVVLLERSDYCAGASGAPSRMIHGGLRYMETGEFRLVRESLAERNRLLRNAPHYVAPLPTTVPVFEWFSGVSNALMRLLGRSQRPSRRGALIIKTGLVLYDLFTRKNRVMPRHRFRSRGDSLARWPDLHPEIRCTATYYDASITYPERLGIEMIADAEAAHDGAVALNHAGAASAEGDGVVLEDRLGDERLTLHPKVVVNATGAWIDLTNRGLTPTAKNRQAMIGGTKGSHLVVANERLRRALDGHMVYYENHEGRVCILFPYFDHVLVGSTDLKVETPEGVYCDDDERDYILRSLRYVFPDIEIRPDEILYTFSGVRPLANKDAATTGQLSRDHECREMPAEYGLPFPVLCMIGGKWTTFRSFGEQVADRVLDYLGRQRRCHTRDRAIGGGAAFPESAAARTEWARELAEAHGLDVAHAQRLMDRYGSRAASLARYLAEHADGPLVSAPAYTRREMRWLIEHEQAETLDDLVARRTCLAINGDVSMDVLVELAGILGECRGWSAGQRRQAVDACVEKLWRLNRVSEATLCNRNKTEENDDVQFA